MILELGSLAASTVALIASWSSLHSANKALRAAEATFEEIYVYGHGGRAIPEEQGPVGPDSPLDTGVVVNILSLVGVVKTRDQIQEWTEEQRVQAARWASAVHLSASDNINVKVPPRPEFLGTP